MKKLTALLLAIVLAISLCTAAVAADDESVTIVLVPEDETLLTAEDLALFFVDRDAVDEEIETSVSWYKETTKDGKTERELVEEMPLIIKITAVGPRIFVDVSDGYNPSQELIDLVKAYAPEKDPNSEHEYRWHRIFKQSCRWLGLRYGTCKDCYGIEFDLCRGNHSYKDGACTVCGKKDPDEEPGECEHEFGNYIDNSDDHYRECIKCGYKEISNHDDPGSCETIDSEEHRFFCQTCDHTFYSEEHNWERSYTEVSDGVEVNDTCKDCGLKVYRGTIG